MCFYLNLHLLPRTGRRRPLDLTDDDTLALIDTTADRCRLGIDIVGWGGVEGYHLIGTQAGFGCACNVAHTKGVDSTFLDFAWTLARSLDLEAVRLLWLWSNDDPMPEQTMTFEDFEVRNRKAQVAENTPYLLFSAEPTGEQRPRAGENEDA